MDSFWNGLSNLIGNKPNRPSSGGGGYRPNVHSFTSQSAWRETKTSTQSQASQQASSYKKSYVIDGEEITQNKIDDILDKISASGYGSLSEKEKFILNELSKRL